MISLQLQPTSRQLRVFGAASLLCFGLLGWWLRVDARPVWALVCWLAAGSAGLSALAFPKANLPLYLALTLIAFPVGVILSWLLLAVMWYLVITPIALVFLLLGKDPLQRKWDRSAATYWLPYPHVHRRERYFRQF